MYNQINLCKLRFFNLFNPSSMFCIKKNCTEFSYRVALLTSLKMNLYGKQFPTDGLVNNPLFWEVEMVDFVFIFDVFVVGKTALVLEMVKRLMYRPICN